MIDVFCSYRCGFEATYSSEYDIPPTGCPRCRCELLIRNYPQPVDRRPRVPAPDYTERIYEDRDPRYQVLQREPLPPPPRTRQRSPIRYDYNHDRRPPPLPPVYSHDYDRREGRQPSDDGYRHAREDERYERDYERYERDYERYDYERGPERPPPDYGYRQDSRPPRTPYPDFDHPSNQHPRGRSELDYGRSPARSSAAPASDDSLGRSSFPPGRGTSYEGNRPPPRVGSSIRNTQTPQGHTHPSLPMRGGPGLRPEAPPFEPRAFGGAHDRPPGNSYTSQSPASTQPSSSTLLDTIEKQIGEVRQSIEVQQKLKAATPALAPATPRATPGTNAPATSTKPPKRKASELGPQGSGVAEQQKRQKDEKQQYCLICHKHGHWEKPFCVAPARICPKYETTWNDDLTDRNYPSRPPATLLQAQKAVVLNMAWISDAMETRMTKRDLLYGLIASWLQSNVSTEIYDQWKLFMGACAHADRTTIERVRGVLQGYMRFQLWNPLMVPQPAQTHRTGSNTLSAHQIKTYEEKLRNMKGDDRRTLINDSQFNISVGFMKKVTDEHHMLREEAFSLRNSLRSLHAMHTDSKLRKAFFTTGDAMIKMIDRREVVSLDTDNFDSKDIQLMINEWTAILHESQQTAVPLPA